MNLEEVKKSDYSWVLEYLKRETVFDGQRIEEQINWLIEQAERVEIYKKALMEIGAKHEPPASKIANEALWRADYERNK
ncbi:hypothetical protein [Halalkalibacter krulwichiae]|uniref:Uncharacterized protein n=1 Tax=Halalkalibacter krulwichiae TaxID=199441 RepID=A0A1X9M5P7_9BACI|nr:hypothetical protein [Halalkalibacter krulwichiae]ARK28768.1 hypothetical protein BkAM31D_02275 [Halalkalibacter krulwichiae]